MVQPDRELEARRAVLSGAGLNLRCAAREAPAQSSVRGVGHGRRAARGGLARGGSGQRAARPGGRAGGGSGDRGGPEPIPAGGSPGGGRGAGPSSRAAFVRLARMGTGFRAIARMLRSSPNTEREYRKVLAAEGMPWGMIGPRGAVFVLHMREFYH